MVALLLSWAFTGWLSLVFGIAGLRVLNAYLKKEKSAIHETGVDYLILSGFILITTLAGMISIVSPLNGLVTGLFSLSGAGLTYRYRSDLVQILQTLREGWKAMAWSFKLAIISIFTISLLSVTLDFGESDVWFYHAQAIQWIEKYAAVPGLGNLHGRFAFNSHFFISSAVFTLWFSGEYIVFPVLSFFFLIFTTRLIVNIHSGLKQGKWTWFVLNSLLLILCTFQFFPVIHGTATDEMTAILLLYAFLLFLEPAFDNRNNTGLMVLWGLVLTAVTFKVSSILTGILLIFTLPQIFRTQKVILFFSAALVILAPFLIRNILLSGYLLYPVPQIDVLSVDWKIPMNEVILEKELIEGWARLPHGGADIAVEDIPKILAVPFGEWFREWWPTRSLKWQGIMVADLFTVVLLFFALFRKDFRLAALCFVLIVNLLFWFMKAPAPRFGLACLLMSFGLVLSYGLAPFFRYLKPDHRIFIPIAILIIPVLTLRNGISFIHNPEPSLLLITKVPAKIEPDTFRAKNFTVYVPPAAPPARGIWCYNLPAPCTPYPKENLMMRGATYQAGFRVQK